MTEDRSPGSLGDEGLLRAVVAEALQYPETADFELGQIYAGTIMGDPAREALWAELTGPENAQVGIHLDGEVVHGHSVDVDLVVDLIGGIANATQATSNDRLKKLRSQRSKPRKKTGDLESQEAGGGRPIRITAISPGSFEFVLEAQPPAAPEGSAEGQTHQIGDAYQPSLDDTALTDVVNALFSDGLDGALDKLPAGAKKALYPAAKALVNDKLEVTSRLVQRNLAPIQRVKNQINATVLKSELEKDDTNRHTIKGVVKFDGYKQSKNIVYLFIGNQPKSREVIVDNNSLLMDLRRWSAAADDELWVDISAELKITTSVSKKTQTSLTLIYAEQAEKPEELGDQISIDEIIAEIDPDCTD